MKRSFAVLLLGCCLVPAVAQNALEPIAVPEATMQRFLIHKVNPVLPEEPASRVEGAVLLSAIINKAGSIESLQIVTGDPMLVPAALNAVNQWKYRPYEVNGIPRAVTTTIRVECSNTKDEESEASTLQLEAPVAVTAEDLRGLLVYRVAPMYPPLARQARIQGMVILRIVINKLGEVRETQLVSGHPMLVPAAVDAVKKWRYIPYESDGKTLEIETDVQIVFRLAGG